MMSYMRMPDWSDLDIRTIITSTLVVGVVVRLALQGRKHDKIFRSPRETVLPKLTEKEKHALPYPPDLLPGARDVKTPYGMMRVYEFGPENGRKVLLIHGITTPSLALGSIALELVEMGCRVMLFDLWGRGYSEAPTDLDHDSRLYVSQIMFALASSDLTWKSFSLIGYSMGGGISTNFASYFPQMIDSLVLLAPAGLIRPENLGTFSKFLYSSGIIPEKILLWIVKRRMRGGPIRPPSKAGANKTKVEDAGKAEAENPTQTSQDVSLFKSHPNVSVPKAVQWQVTAHDGFIPAFMSSVRYAPLSGQQAAWKQIGLSLSTPAISRKKEWQNNKILVIAGRIDPVIIPEELKEDIDSLIEPDHYQWELVDGAHDFPSLKSVDTVKIIAEFWRL